MTTKEAINILYTEATQEEFTHSRKEIEQAKQVLLSNYDPVDDAREYSLYQFFKDKPKFIKLGNKRIDLKRIKEYSICTTREPRILPDGTCGIEEGFGLMIWLHNENCYHTVDCETKEEAEKLQEKLDNVFDVIDLEKENKNG